MPPKIYDERCEDDDSAATGSAMKTFKDFIRNSRDEKTCFTYFMEHNWAAGSYSKTPGP